MSVDLKEVWRCALAELAYLRQKSQRLDRALGGASFPEEVSGSGEPILDPDTGEELFYKVPLRRDGKYAGYVKVGIHAAVGAPLAEVSVRRDGTWEDLREGALEAARRERPTMVVGELRFVDFSHPKVGAQFLDEDGREVLLMEVESWRIIDPGDEHDPVSDRRPFLQGLAPGARQENELRYAEHLASFEIGTPGTDAVASAAPHAVQHQGRSHELNYSESGFQPYKQETWKWCFAASIQMILGFHKALRNVQAAQPLIACELGLGTVARPKALWASEREFEVVRVIEELSGRRLVAAMNAAPYSFPTHLSKEIEDGRPSILLTGSHTSVVTGFTEVKNATGELLSYKVHLEDPYSGGSFALMDLNPALSRLVFTAAPGDAATRSLDCSDLATALAAGGARPAPPPPAR